MISMTVKVVYDNLPKIVAQGNSNAAKAVKRATQNINKITREMMGEPKTGNIYPRGATGLHQASSPGESPAIDTKQLVTSLSESYSDLTGYAYTDVDYSVYLEFGTSRMRKRPFYTPAAQLEWPDFVKEMSEIYGTG